MAPDKICAAKELLSYDRQNGCFYWVSGPLRGRRAGSYSKNIGYEQIKVCGVAILTHRLVWIFEKGGLPDCFLDHINGDKRDNRIVNLRLANRSENQCNKGLQRNNTSGFKGVHFSTNMKKWVAKIKKDRRWYYLGQYSCAETAHDAYCKAAKDLHGEFARVK